MKFRPVPVIPEGSRLKTIASGTAEVFKLDPRLIEREKGLNPRYDFGDTAALAEDILVNDLLQALKVRKEGTRIFLVDGDRRLSAVELLLNQGRWPEDPRNPGYPKPIPCTSEGPGVKPLDRIFMMLSLNTGKPFTLLEKGLAYQEILLHDSTINASEIARRSGETKQAVSNALQIINHASPTLIDHIKADRISATTSLGIIKSTDGHDEQNAAAAKAIGAAKESGKDHATPKHLPAKKKTAASSPPPADPQTSTEDNTFIADLSDESDHDSPDSHPPEPEPSIAPGSTTADPSAFERLRNAPSSNRDGSSASSGAGSGYAAADKRATAIEKLLDELDKDNCHTQRWDTIELVLDYLNGNHTVTTIKKHLLQ